MPLLVDHLLRRAAAAAPRRVALTLGDAAITFGALHRRSHRLANALVGLGISRGDRVAYWADLCLDAATVKLALARIGAVFAPLNPASSDVEAGAVLEYLAPQLVIVDASHAERAATSAGASGMALATIGGRGPGAQLDKLMAVAVETEPSTPLPHEDDIVTIFLTSGSTGLPKGVAVSQRATFLRSYGGCAPEATTGGNGPVVMFPLYHMAGWLFTLCAWSMHQPAHLVPRADAGSILGAVERHAGTSLYCIPAVWHRILEERHRYRLDSLRWTLVGTSRVDLDLVTAIKQRFPESQTTISYGSSEVGRALALPDRDLFRKVGTVGIPVPYVEARVADDGELLIRADTLMSGYHELPDETSRALVDGWYHTGDLAERDDEGYYSIIGRTREVIRTGGEWVAPVEVEAALADYPHIAELAIVGLPDTKWGEIVCAAVVMANGCPPPSIDDLRHHLADRLAAYKHPRQLLVLDALPRTSVTGQVQRPALSSSAARLVGSAKT